MQPIKITAMLFKKQLPNFITLLNLFCGCIALVFVSKLNFEMAFFFVALGIFFDFFDGFFARLFKVSSPLGLQLDSLADMVTSGLVPGFAMYQMLFFSQHEITFAPWFPYVGFIISMASCYRLANFNIDVRQTNSFIGLPTPANAIFILSLPLVGLHSSSIIALELLTSQGFLLFIIVLSAWMLNASIPLFSLKFKNFSVIDNKIQYVFLFLSGMLLFFFKFVAIPFVLVLYVLLSVVTTRFLKK